MERYPFIFSDERKYRLWRHLAFWTFWWIFQAFLYSFIAWNSNGRYNERLIIAFVESFIFTWSHMFLAYTLMYVVIPRFLLQQRYWATAVLTITLFLVTAWISVLLGNYIINPIINMLADRGYVFRDEMKPIIIHRSMMGGLRGGLTTAGIAAAIKLMKHWYVKEQRNLQLQKENVASQLQLLKAQVHPHFLFNTLNNIYSHTQDTAPVAARLITGLSDILRFILYEGNNSVVPLAKELQMIRDYIELEKIRYGNRLELHLDLPDNTDDLYITPLLLLPLVENSFKHGASSMLDQPWINMRVTLQDTRMHLKLVNGKTGMTQSLKPSGIGIQNVKTRLALLYPGKHEFYTSNEEEVFILNLKMELERKRPAPVLKIVSPDARHWQKQV